MLFWTTTGVTGKSGMRSSQFRQVFGPVLLLASLLSSATWAAQKAAPISTNYTVDALTDSVYVIHGPIASPNPDNQGFMNNPGFVVTAVGVVVIDPGSSVQAGEMVLKNIRKISDKLVIATFATHIHGDHWLGNQAIIEAYPDARLYGHAHTIEKIADGEGETWLDLMLQVTEGATEGTQVASPTIAVDDGDSLAIGGKTFQIIHKGPAHNHRYHGSYCARRCDIFGGQCLE